MRGHWLQHVPFEGLGHIETCLQRAGHELSSTRLFAGAPLPAIEAIDFLVVMGGPMSVNEVDTYPWLREETDWIRSVIAADKPVLGVCLGAQLIARALGAEVRANPVKEIGWWPIRVVRQGDAPVKQQTPGLWLPDAMEVFHWHGETFDLPTGASRLAESDGCQNQAFQVGRRVLGLQFHLETTPASARALVTHCREDLVSGPFIQSEADILATPTRRYDAANRLLEALLEQLLNG